MATENQTKSFTDAQATDEAMLLLTRKFRRMFPQQFQAVWGKLPAGAQRAIYASEIRADVLRDKPIYYTWPKDEDEDEGEE